MSPTWTAMATTGPGSDWARAFSLTPPQSLRCIPAPPRLRSSRRQRSLDIIARDRLQPALAFAARGQDLVAENQAMAAGFFVLRQHPLGVGRFGVHHDHGNFD